MTEQADLTPGTTFGGYRIERLLGRGGMGAVYAAEQLEDGRQVAVKVLTSGLGSEEDRERFIREGRTAASINHPNTVYVYRTEEIDGLPTITMELVDGGTLEEKVARLGPLSVADAIKDILQIVDGLEAAQRLGILHRDVKPANCFVSPSGDVKVGDFGLSRPVDQVDNTRLTKTGLFLGTPVYSSPEQLMGEKLDVRSDIYAVAATLYYLLTGKLPYEADNAVRLIAVVMSGAPTPLNTHRPDVPDAVNALVMRCLTRKREERFANYDELREALIACQPAAMVPAPILRRLVAGIADSYALSVITTPIFLAVAKSMGISVIDIVQVSDGVTVSSKAAQASLLQLAIAVPIEIVWFGIFEGRFGWSPGKLLLGLRVARVEGGRPGFMKGAIRSLAVVAPGVISVLATVPISNSLIRAYALQGVFLLVLLLLFSRARRSNGYLAEHDRLTGTRVVKYRKGRAPLRAMQAATTDSTPAPASTRARIGPYEVLERVPSSADVVEGFDSDLRRAVWIVRHPEGTPAVPQSERQMLSVNTLRWIGGRRAGTDAWDAYAAVPGRSLRSSLTATTPWEDVHGWMKDIVDALRTRENPGAVLNRLSLDHVWISNEGRAILLPFAYGEQVAETSGRSLLQQYSATVLDMVGQGQQRDGWPLRARSLLQQAGTTSDLDTLHAMLGDADENTGAMSRRRRVSLWASITVPTVLLCALGIAVTTFANMANPDQLRMEPLLGYVGAKSNRADSLAHKRALVGAYVAGHFREAIAKGDRTAAIGKSNSVLSKKEWERADSIIQAHPSVDADLLREADRLVDSTWHGRPPGELNRQTMLPLFGALGFVFFMMLFSIGAAIIARRGLAMRVLGLELVNGRGEPAGRLRLVWRQLLVFVPMAALSVAIVVIFVADAKKVMGAVIAGVALTIVVASIVTALRTPGRGLTERLSGTRMVPE